MTYILDTDMIILLVRGLKSDSRGWMKTGAQLVLETAKKRAAAGDSVGISAITRAELEYGAEKCVNPDHERACLEKILAPFDAFDFTFEAAATAYGPVRAGLESVGVPIGAMDLLDLLIAAHALSLNAILVSGNAAHFDRVKGLRVENWAKAE